MRSDTGQVVKTHPSREKALRHLRALKANVSESVLGVLLEGFADQHHPRGWRGRFRAGDHVRVEGHGVKGDRSIVGRVVRPSDSHPDTHVVIAPQGGGPHVLALVRAVKMDTPARAAGEREKRQTEMRDPRMVSSSRERGLAQLAAERAQKVARPRVRESALDVLLEGFEDARHPRGVGGRWIATFNHSVHGRMSSPVEASSSTEAWSKAEAKAREMSTPGGRINATVQSVTPFDAGARRAVGREADAAAAARRAADPNRPAQGEIWQVRGRGAQGGRYEVQSVTDAHVQFSSQRTGKSFTIPHGEFRQGYSRVGPRKFDSIEQAARAGALPSQRDKTGRPTGRKYDSIGAAARAGALPSQQPNRQQLHAQVTKHLENLPVGRFHSEAMTGGHVRRTAQGFEVYAHGSAQPLKVHRTPSAAAGHLLRLRLREADERPELLGVLLERFVSQGKRGELAKKGHALHVDGKDIFPIENAKDANNAANLWLSGHHKTAQAKAHILRNARRVGATDVVKKLGA